MKPLILFAALFAASSAFAQITIDQNKAMAGGITPGDTPGFPINISQPGHYKLMGNLNAPAGVAGIEILVEGVTLDLNGFAIRAPGTCTRNTTTRIVTCPHYDPQSPGIRSYSADTVVRNGLVRGFGGTGIFMSDRGHVDDLRVSHNGGYGLAISQASATGIEAELNGNHGINGGYNVVTRSVARNNGGSGILAAYVQDSLSTGNKANGIGGGGARGNLSADNGDANFSAAIKSMGGNLNGTAAW